MTILISQATHIASLILQGFDDYRREFKAITRGAQARFEGADWLGAQQAAADRITLYRQATHMTTETLGEMISPDQLPVEDWSVIKREFQTLIRKRPDFDLAETVFNTVFRRTWGGKYLSDHYVFVEEALLPRPQFDADLCRGYGPSYDLGGLLQQMLNDTSFTIAWLDQAGCIAQMVTLMRSAIPLLRQSAEVRFDMLKAVFYRNKGAYLLGKMSIGEHQFPLAIPVHNASDVDDAGPGLFVDTVIWTDSDLSIIFSFTRAYFMVDTDHPNELVTFLQELLPNKKRWELYTALGYYKHGKTEFYRGFLDHLEASDDQFVLAEGIKGLVMSVFTLPSYQVVFKIIKDKFSPTKSVTRQQVKQAYYLVKTHDRVGRMADTQEFTHFKFPRARFSQELLDELQKVAASSVTVTDAYVTISHLYTERLMTPLNLYIRDKSDFELSQVLDEYGNAIKQLAAANIFPGDMLLKNFGVTRHGRVIFYDYDEICYLTKVNFRRIPPPRYPEDTMASEPWYSVGPDDVFPEEFKNFLFSSGKLKELFCEHHADLFTAEFWEELQDNIRHNRIMDVYPYRQKRRFERLRSLKDEAADVVSDIQGQ